MNRRRFLRTSALAGPLAGAVAAAPPPQQAKIATETTSDVTRRLARYVVSARTEDLPESVRKEAARTLLNWVGCAVGGSRHEAVDIAIGALAPFSGPAQATILGRRERMDVLHAALMNGISSHVFDFDDTHLRTVIHPAGPVASAILALAEYRPVSGADFLNALVLGAEVECRIGNAVYPAHYDVGWHITGTVGPFGAAAAVGKLLHLSEQQMVWALGLAATQPVGLREMFGTMTKSFHPGRAAQNGFTAALLASKNFTSSNAGLEAPRGWASVLSTARNYAAITENLGGHYEISENSYKPFPCGVVIHPAIDGCIQLRNQYNLTAGRDRAHRTQGASTGAGTHRQEDAAGRPGRQVQRVSRGRRGDHRWRGGRKAVQRSGGPGPGHRGAARTRDRRSGSRHCRRPGAHHYNHEGPAPPGKIHRTLRRQRQEPYDQRPTGSQVRRTCRGRSAAGPDPPPDGPVLEHREPCPKPRKWRGRRRFSSWPHAPVSITPCTSA